MNICMIHQQQYTDGGYCIYCGPRKYEYWSASNSPSDHPHDKPCDPAPEIIEKENARLCALTAENARLKAAVDGAREVLIPLAESYGVALGDAEKARKWLAANPPEAQS